MSRQIKTLARVAVFWAIALYSFENAWPLSSDREEPMHIEANEVTIDDQKQVSVYRGDVVVTQGTLRVTADKLTVFTRGGDIERVIAVGEPATYKQLPDDREKPVEAEALTMEYRTSEGIVVLTEKAKLWQGPNTFASKRIIYDVAQDHVKAGEEVGGDRVRITVHPDEKTQ